MTCFDSALRGRYLQGFLFGLQAIESRVMTGGRAQERGGPHLCDRGEPMHTEYRRVGAENILLHSCCWQMWKRTLKVHLLDLKAISSAMFFLPRLYLLRTSNLSCKAYKVCTPLIFIRMIYNFLWNPPTVLLSNYIIPFPQCYITHSPIPSHILWNYIKTIK